MPEMNDGWRPDRSGVMGAYVSDGLPPGYAGRFGIRLQVIGSHEVLRTRAFVNLVAYLVEQRIATFLAVPLPGREIAGRSLLNEGLRDAVAADDFDLMVARLETARQECLRVGTQAP